MRSAITHLLATGSITLALAAIGLQPHVAMAHRMSDPHYVAKHTAPTVCSSRSACRWTCRPRVLGSARCFVSAPEKVKEAEARR